LSHQYYAVKDIDPQLISSTSGQFNHAAERLGLENGTVTVSITPLVGIQNVGSPVVYQLNLMEIDSNGINYTLNPGIQFGDEIKYVLNTVYNGWTHQDTITKQFGNINTQFTDVANNASNWTGNWGLSTTTYYSPSSSFTDSPTGNYLNNTTKTFQLNNSIDLTTVSAAMVRFYAKWDIEADYDFCQFQVSTDNGSTWIPQCGKYTVLGTSGSGSVQPNNQPVYEGLQSTWVQEEINLSDYIGSTIKFRFILKSDAGVGKDGFYFDDFEIAYNSTANVDEQTALTYDVYPNPAKSTITIATHNGINKGNLLVLDLNGNTVLNHAISNENSTFSVTNLANGVYTVIMESDGKFSTPSKLVILNN
jgi:hypothetical protein